MSDFDELCGHELIRNFDIAACLGSFLDNGTGSFLARLDSPISTRPIRRALNLARLLQTATHVPGLEIFREGVLKELAVILEGMDAKYLWDIFQEGGRLSATYSSAKILLGLGGSGLSQLRAEQSCNTPKLLHEHLESMLQDRLDAHPFLIALSVDALHSCGLLNEPSRRKAGEWADRYLYMLQSQLDHVGPGSIAAINLCLALGVVAHHNLGALSRQRMSSLLGALVKYYPVLPTHARAAITRLEGHAVGCSAVDALLPLVTSEFVVGELFSTHASYLLDVLRWLWDHSVIRPNGARVFATDVFIDERPYELWFNSAVCHFLRDLRVRCALGWRDVVVRGMGGGRVDGAFPWDDLKIGGYRWPAVI